MALNPGLAARWNRGLKVRVGPVSSLPGTLAGPHLAWSLPLPRAAVPHPHREHFLREPDLRELHQGAEEGRGKGLDDTLPLLTVFPGEAL